MKKEMEKENNIIRMAYQNMKENILMEKDMEKEKDILKMVNQNLKENI